MKRKNPDPYHTTKTYGSHSVRTGLSPRYFEAWYKDTSGAVHYLPGSYNTAAAASAAAKRAAGGRKNPATAFNVSLRGKRIDTVFYSAGHTAADVKQSLIRHDGYDPAITVTKATKTKARKNPRSASTKAQRGRMYVRMRDDAAGYQGMGGHDSKYDAAIKALAGKVVEVDTTHLFDDQYNLKDYPVRVFDKQIVEVINDQRRGKGKSSWSGAMGPTKGPKAAAFAAAARAEYEGSQYRKPGDPHDAVHGRVKALHVRAPAAPKRFGGSWGTAGTVKQVFKNGNVALSSGAKLEGVAKPKSDAAKNVHVGQKVYVSPEGEFYFVRMISNHWNEGEGPIPDVLVVKGNRVRRHLRPQRSYGAEKIYGPGYRTLSTTQVLAKARAWHGHEMGW